MPTWPYLEYMQLSACRTCFSYAIHLASNMHKSSYAAVAVMASQPCLQQLCFDGLHDHAYSNPVSYAAVVLLACLQSVLLVELDGPRPRTVGVQVVGNPAPQQ